GLLWSSRPSWAARVLRYHLNGISTMKLALYTLAFAVTAALYQPLQAVECAKSRVAQIPRSSVATDAAKPKAIVETAAGIEDFSTLVAAVKAGGLVDTPNGKGPSTVFAPTNEAFAKLPN